MSITTPQANDTLVQYFTQRRSAPAKELGGPGPTEAELRQILEIAHRTPDHGKLGPWRFVVIEGEARARFGEQLAKRYRELNPEASEQSIDLQRALPHQAPTLIAVIAAPRPHVKIPEWEQILAVGAACMNLLHGAQALGFGAQWLTGWHAYDTEILRCLGGDPAAGDRVAGMMYIGTAAGKPGERVRPPLAERLSHYQPGDGIVDP